MPIPAQDWPMAAVRPAPHPPHAPRQLLWPVRSALQALLTRLAVPAVILGSLCLAACQPSLGSNSAPGSADAPGSTAGGITTAAPSSAAPAMSLSERLAAYDQLARNWGNFTQDSAGDSDYRAADVVMMKLQWFDERGIPEVMFGLVEDPDSAFAAEVREMLGVLSPTQPMIYPEVRAESGSTPADRTLTHDMANAPGNRLMLHVGLVEGHWMLRGFFYEARGIRIGDINT
jgi:hypothetical protein